LEISLKEEAMTVEDITSIVVKKVMDCFGIERQHASQEGSSGAGGGHADMSVSSVTEYAQN
jgi:hypothetical protein